MERNEGDHSQKNNNFSPDETQQINGDPALGCSNLWLDHVGEVSLTLDSNGLSWNLIKSTTNEQEGSFCLGLKLSPKNKASIKLSEVYAVEFADWGSIHEFSLANARVCLLGHNFELHMYRFSVHTVQRSKNQPSLWAPFVYTFGHKDSNVCQVWVNRITDFLNLETERPKNLLVFVHPKSGKGNGCRTWETVAPIFSRAKVKTKVIVTEKSGHAYSAMSSIANEELNSYDGVIAVGGDGFFNEILNGLLLQRLKAPHPPVPANFFHSDDLNFDNSMGCDENESSVQPSDHNASSTPLLPVSTLYDLTSTNLRTANGDFDSDEGSEFSIPNKWFRLGLIPAGSTDAIVICTTGARDSITSALHIVLGKRVSLDIAQIVRWKTTSTSTSKEEPCVRYAASFAGYGFYGDVISESEKYRWMGPKRYDYAGTMVFLKHKSYEAEVACLEEESGEISSSEKAPQSSRKRALWGLPKKTEKMVCRANCEVCKANANSKALQNIWTQTQQDLKWLRSKGRFLSIGGAIISNRNERAPDGLVADAHLADGYLDLILIKECPHALYLWHLTQLARKGGTPLNFEFVEHYKTRAFSFTSSGKESVWNLDGEIFQAHQLSAQVFRGLVSLFASGPEV